MYPYLFEQNRLVLTEQELINACRKGNRRAQQMLFDQYSPTMFGTLRRYLRRREDAEDVLVEAFYKVLTNIGQFKGKGSFEGWIRRIVINEALMFLRKSYNFSLHVEIDKVDLPRHSQIQAELEAEDILRLLDKLPLGYRTVFNLYVLEGFKHREIAEQLGISINTSKSQLILAKKRMQEALLRVGYPGIPSTGPSR